MKGQDNMQMVVGALVVLLLAGAVLYMGPNFETMLTNMQQVGFFTYVLPFALVFAVVYAVLRSTKIVDNLTAFILALVTALFGLLFLSTVPVLGFLSYFLGRIGIVLIILLVIYMFYAFMTKEEE